MGAPGSYRTADKNDVRGLQAVGNSLWYLRLTSYPRLFRDFLGLPVNRWSVVSWNVDTLGH